MRASLSPEPREPFLRLARAADISHGVSGDADGANDSNGSCVPPASSTPRIGFWPAPLAGHGVEDRLMAGRPGGVGSGSGSAGARRRGSGNSSPGGDAPLSGSCLLDFACSACPSEGKGMSTARGKRLPTNRPRNANPPVPCMACTLLTGMPSPTWRAPPRAHWCRRGVMHATPHISCMAVEHARGKRLPNLDMHVELNSQRGRLPYGRKPTLRGRPAYGSI
eukprot:365138-Chlamydomonas_euryale.AAC.1